MGRYGEVTILAFKGDLFQPNFNSLLQLALLLTADPQAAEAHLETVIGNLDLSERRADEPLAVLQTAVARQSIESGGIVSVNGLAEARSLLQPGLLPILQLERLPRLCFVLRMLVGFATSACARMLGIDESSVRVLLGVAVLQLHHASSIYLSEKSPDQQA